MLETLYYYALAHQSDFGEFLGAWSLPPVREPPYAARRRSPEQVFGKSSVRLSQRQLWRRVRRAASVQLSPASRHAACGVGGIPTLGAATCTPGRRHTSIARKTVGSLRRRVLVQGLHRRAHLLAAGAAHARPGRRGAYASSPSQIAPSRPQGAAALLSAACLHARLVALHAVA